MNIMNIIHLSEQFMRRAWPPYELKLRPATLLLVVDLHARAAAVDVELRVRGAHGLEHHLELQRRGPFVARLRPLDSFTALRGTINCTWTTMASTPGLKTSLDTAICLFSKAPRHRRLGRVHVVHPRLTPDMPPL